MGELIRLPLRLPALEPGRSWRDNEADRLQAIANVAGTLTNLVKRPKPSCAERDMRAIMMGRQLLTSLALLDLTPAGTHGREDTVVLQTERIEDLIRDWQAVLDARCA